MTEKCTCLDTLTNNIVSLRSYLCYLLCRLVSVLGKKRKSLVLRGTCLVSLASSQSRLGALLVFSNLVGAITLQMQYVINTANHIFFRLKNQQIFSKGNICNDNQLIFKTLCFQNKRSLPILLLNRTIISIRFDDPL